MAETPELRASDADREQTAELLRRAAGDGRLTVDELDERLDRGVRRADPRRQLEELIVDVVVSGDARRPGRRSRRVAARRARRGREPSG